MEVISNPTTDNFEPSSFISPDPPPASPLPLFPSFQQNATPSAGDLETRLHEDPVSIDATVSPDAQVRVPGLGISDVIAAGQVSQQRSQNIHSDLLDLMDIMDGGRSGNQVSVSERLLAHLDRVTGATYFRWLSSLIQVGYQHEIGHTSSLEGYLQLPPEQKLLAPEILELWSTASLAVRQAAGPNDEPVASFAIGRIFLQHRPLMDQIFEAAAMNITHIEDDGIIPWLLNPGTAVSPQSEATNSETEDGPTPPTETPDWATLVEDTTRPTSEELEELERQDDQVSALDHHHFKSSFFQPTNDAEHIPGTGGSFSWVCERVRGTRESPNFESIRKSDAFLIDGYRWTLTFYPRGKGSDHMSVFVECAPDLNETSSHDDAWEVAAQIGCVVYNPNEPRVHFGKFSSHRFCAQNPDRGWTRFHGPWNTTQERRHLQHAALLRDDQLAFTVYIRTIEDKTGGLYWHQPFDGQGWNSVSKTGYRGITWPMAEGSALVAALSIWFHLAPVYKHIMECEAADPVYRPIRPLHNTLQEVFKSLNTLDGSTDPVVIHGINEAQSWYNEGKFDPSGDSFYTWDRLVEILHSEAPTKVKDPGSRKIFEKIGLLRQLGPIYQPQMEPSSAQQTVDCLMSSPYIRDPGFCDYIKPPSSNPLILHVELHRHKYDRNARKMRKLTHFIELNETIKFKGTSAAHSSQYTLFSIIVHKGGLKAGRHYAIIRPRGPKSIWISYGIRNERDVVNMTNKQAVQDHEGSDETLHGERAVAHIVTYVRSDCLSDTSFTTRVQPAGISSSNEVSIAQSSNNNIASVANASSDSDDNEMPAMATILIFASSLALGHKGLQLFDLQASLDQPKESGNWHCFRMERTKTIADIKDYLVSELKVPGAKYSRLFVLGTKMDMMGPSPHFVSKCLEDRTIETYATEVGCRFLIHRMDQDRSSFLRITGDTLLLPDIYEDEDIIMGEGRHHHHTHERTAAGTLARYKERGTRWESRMQHDVAPVIQTAFRTGADLQLDTGNFIFVKIFDRENQELRCIGCHFVPHDCNVRDTITILYPSYNIKHCDLHLELLKGAKYCQPISEDTLTSWVERSYGPAIIISERISRARQNELQGQGKYTSIQDYIGYLRQKKRESAYEGERVLHNYLGTPYCESELFNGHRHGAFTCIDLDGNELKGRMDMGIMTLDPMQMRYANGDTYHGTWVDGKPQGQGVMKYKSGNVYVGNWERGHRVGQGKMEYKISEFEQSLCKICFDTEIDACLVDCGHVAICYECAQKLDEPKTCPICRKRITKAVKMYRL